jgi:hypothetical protein
MPSRPARRRQPRRHLGVAAALALILHLSACGFESSQTSSILEADVRTEVALPESVAAQLDELEFPVLDTPRSIVLDEFDSHRWSIDRDSGAAVPTVTYAAERSTQGSGALHLQTPLTAAPPDLNDNIARLDVTLPESEDWSGFDVVTFDVYMAENPTGLAEARLYLANSAGESAETPLILGWQLFQWENHQMTFPLKGNAHRIPEVPATILSDVKHVGIAITRFSDRGFGTPYPELNFALDNMRLDGAELWDSFDQPAWAWQSTEPETGITHNERFAAGAGSLRLSGHVTGTPTFQRTETTPISVVSAKVKAPGDPAPVAIELHTDSGVHAADSTTTFGVDDDGWETVIWQLPERITPHEITKLEFRTPAGSTVYLDSLELVPDASQPFDIDVAPTGGQTALQWRNPFRPATDTIRVWARGTEDGLATPVCEVSAHTEVGACLHDTTQNPAQEYVYLLVPEASDGGGTPASGDDQTIHLRPEGTDYRLGLASRNGALRYIQNAETGAVLSSGSGDDNLWSVSFVDEATLPSLRANQFSPESTTHRFTFNESPVELIYSYDEAGRQLTLTIEVVPVDEQRFDLRASITNDTGYAIRAVSLPEQLMFEVNGLERVLFPIQEGLTLLPQFFEEHRSTTMARPPMFADVLAYEADRGDLAIHMVQDSRYQAALIPHHPADEPVFQPNNLSTGGVGDRGFFQFGMVTFIPHGARWESGAVRFSIDRDFRQVAADYRLDNGIDEFPTLAEKLGGDGAFQQLAASPIFAVEVYKAVEWQKTPEGETWSAIRGDWLDRLPEPGVLHLTHWQEGRDWYTDEHENHKLEDDHPEALPIWWERYGSEEEFSGLLAALGENGYLTMPFTNWTVWNTYDPTTLDIPTLEQTPAAARKIRGTDYPYIEYKGYMVEPWADDVRERNTSMFETYTDVYPQDLMFVDMTGERSWRYVTLEDGETASAAAYTQGVVNENLRLSRLKPLFTEGVFDRIGNSVAGYAQTLRQKMWNQILAHLGHEWEHWVAYPFAADVLHDKVAFYQHDLNSEVWPGEDMALASYYSLYGYNYMVDVTKHVYEDEDTIWALDALQKSVNARTFGQPLLNVETLSPSRRLQRTTWGPAENPIEITANFDGDQTSRPASLAGYGIAPDGFAARTADGDMVAGMFIGEFAGAPLTDGVHWITVERGPRQVEVRHPRGANTPIRVARPSDWVDDAHIGVEYELADESMVPANPDMLEIVGDGLHVLMPTELLAQPVRRALVTYGDGPARWSEEPLTFSSEGPPTAESTGPAAWRVDAQSSQNWQTDNTTWTAASDQMILALTDAAAGVGRAESEPITLAVGGGQSLALEVVSIRPAARLIVQIQEMFGEYRAFDAVTITDPGDYSVGIDQLVGSASDDPYAVVLWLEGVGASVGFQMIEIGSAGRVGTGPGAFWHETFDAEPEGWLADNAFMRVEDGALAFLVADRDIGYGKVETAPLLIDVGATPMLEIDVVGVDAETSFSIQLQEQSGAYAAIDVRNDIVAPAVLRLDLREYVTTRGENPYRLVFWVSGRGSLTVDDVTVGTE